MIWKILALLACLSSPSSLSQFFQGMLKERNPRKIALKAITINLLVYVLILAIIYAWNSKIFKLVELFSLPYSSEGIFCLLGAVALGPILILVEAMIGVIALRLKNPTLKFRVEISSGWATMPMGGIFLSLLLVILEEITFRGLWIGLLGLIGVSPIGSILISSGFYGINHINFGKNAPFQKFFTGILLGTLYIIFGLLPCIMAHLCQNLVLAWLGKKKSKGGDER